MRCIRRKGGGVNLVVSAIYGHGAERAATERDIVIGKAGRCFTEGESNGGCIPRLDGGCAAGNSDRGVGGDGDGLGFFKVVTPGIGGAHAHGVVASCQARRCGGTQVAAADVEAGIVVITRTRH